MDMIEEVINNGKKKMEPRKHFGASIKLSLFNKILELRNRSGVTVEGIVIAGVESIEKRLDELRQR